MSRMNDLSKAIIKLEHLLESDPRTFKNPKSENGWIFDDIHEVLKILKSMSCSEFPNKWIPCSVKKHPDKSMYCHVTVIDYDGDCIVENDDWDVDSESWNEYSDDEIIAWMPEIQPYQPKEDES